MQINKKPKIQNITEKGKPQRHCVLVRDYFHFFPDNQSLSPFVSAFSVLGRLEKHLVWNI